MTSYFPLSNRSSRLVGIWWSVFIAELKKMLQWSFHDIFWSLRISYACVVKIQSLAQLLVEYLPPTTVACAITRSWTFYHIFLLSVQSAGHRINWQYRDPPTKKRCSWYEIKLDLMMKLHFSNSRECGVTPLPLLPVPL